MAQHSLTHPQAIPAIHISTPARRSLALLLGTLFLAVCAHLSVPLFFTPIPISVQPFGVLVVGLLFGPTLGFATLAAYLLEGACGLPVFAPGAPGGMLHLLGPTGGYILAYPFAAALAGFLWRRARGFAGAAGAALTAEVVIFTSGACRLSVLTHREFDAILRTAVLPFVPGDLLKIAAAAAVAVLARRTFDRTQPSAQAPGYPEGAHGSAARDVERTS
jgi:biotin transport system substrate-specific component